MTDNERAVIEAAVEWQHMREAYGAKSGAAELREVELTRALHELHNEHDGRWEPSDD